MRNPPRRTGRRAAALGVALASLALSACREGEAETVATLQSTDVVTGDLRITAEATGTVEPIRKVEVKSKASGEVLALSVDVGDQVEVGSLLARIDPRDVQNAFAQAEADLEVAQARFEIAEAQAGRSRELVDAGVITAQEYEGARLELANADAALIKARTNLELAELRLTDVTITAPLAGTIIQKSVEEGQVIQSASGSVSGGTTLFVMANLQEMQVRTLVDETDMGQIRSGMTANVRVEAFPDRQFLGYVEKIEPQAVVQQNVTMFPVIVRLGNGEGLLRPGMNAEVEVLVDQANGVLLVPNNAIVLPQDVGPAALVLGVDPATLDLAALSGRGAPPAGAGAPVGADGQAAPRQVAGPGGASARVRSGAADPATAARMDSLRARVRRGEITQDSARALMPGERRRGGAPGAAAGPGGTLASVPDVPAREVRPAVVFVLSAQGAPEPRAVQIGLNDWDHTEIVSGVEAGEKVAVIGAAQLQARQQEFLDRVRQRGGGMFPGGGGFGRGGRGG